MIFLSAQPDSLYLKWQIEIFLFNISKFNVPKEQIHMIISYDPLDGINKIYTTQEDPIFKKASFFFYPDNRTNRQYTSSMRPHVLKKHFDQFPDLENEVVFYHDVDIIFRSLPNFEKLCKGSSWYVSDTLNYTSANAIKRAGKLVLQEMAEVINMPIRLIELNDTVSGGAQYIMKGLTYEFWQKVESDSEMLYSHLLKNQKRYEEIFISETGKLASQYPKVIEWCADMWALIWTAFYNNVTVSISDELDFCWPKDDLERWDKVKIFHNAGLDQEDSWQYFYKGDFIHSTPFNTPLEYIRQDKCSIKYVDEIKSYLRSIRLDLRDTTFLIPVRIDSDDRLNNLYTITAFIDKYIDTNFIIIEADESQKIDINRLPKNTDYEFILDNDPNFHRTRYNNQMIRKANTEIITLQDTDVIIAPDQLLLAVNHIRNDEGKMVIPYDGCFKMVYDTYQIEHFRKKLDIKILHGKGCYTVREKSSGGAVLIHRKTYIESGMENEKFYKWGPEDIERVRRMEILGYKPIWVDSGHLYHLRHEVHSNSQYTTKDEFYKLMRVQLDVLSMSSEQLKSEIKNWYL